MREGALIVAVAIKGNNSKTKGVIRWALQEFASQEHVVFKLLHVQPKTGDSMSVSTSRKGSTTTVYKKDVDRKTREMLHPSSSMFAHREVQLDMMVLESDDVADAISKAVQDHGISELVIGASSSSIIFSWKLKRSNLSSRIADVTPRFCTVHVISKGKLVNVRKSDVDIETSIADDRSESQFSSSSQSGSVSSTSSHQFSSTSLLYQRVQALSTVNQKVGTNMGTTKSIDTHHSRAASLDVDEPNQRGYYRTNSSLIRYKESDIHSRRSSLTEEGSSSGCYSDPTSCSSQMNKDFELEKLKIELRHIKGMYAVAQSEVLDATKKMQDLNQRRSEEATRLKNLTIREEYAEEAVEMERERQEEAENEAELVRESVERETEERLEAEARAEEVRKEKQRLEDALEGGPLQRQQYMKFEWEDIVQATSSFSDELKIGTGGYGSVYRCNLHHATVAVKVLHSDKSSLTKQFHQELEILSKIRHPHLLLLLGACPERGSLVYEYMHNGNLEERLMKRRPNTDAPQQPLLWFERFRIAWEIASALYFLHTNEPRPIVHRDLKPANILLDQNNVSKIGDVGLSKMVNLDPSHASTVFNETGPVGTFFYIDPEYQRTGVVTPESDIYAFGIILLQLATARSAMGLAHSVEKALRDQTGNFSEILDETAGDWPVKEAKEMVMIGLRCAEMRKRDRPYLGKEILPVLERLKDVASDARNMFSETGSKHHNHAPSHFYCPITKDVMENPCVASDGYTYEKRAIKEWLEKNHKSPMTDSPFPNQTLLPNHSLLFAIKEWRSLHRKKVQSYKANSLVD
ncbi:PREDICTED: U-box domain-containing protein 51 isoform X1 [Brassica oleracea var. oleracea]|uniref:U-box domain-containing protein 51 isoform X1 n=1 Tax=Brassica oleracea var. oleracea TaxID=109376 RepID=UPI0006A71DDE|nr:PREDICTED: U-box domain-containing protein 51 isoform X1 [Brassica oleracea var. oleracea]XP_013599110.1 PREDICTED: U-box domain-containing protein 51 isoform X1 [Brassica oleracea var. oleracea]